MISQENVYFFMSIPDYGLGEPRPVLVGDASSSCASGHHREQMVQAFLDF